MSHTWILDVLADLKVYARKNKLMALAEHLDDAHHVAVAEFNLLSGGPSLVVTEREEAVCAGNDGRSGRAI